MKAVERFDPSKGGKLVKPMHLGGLKPIHYRALANQRKQDSLRAHGRPKYAN